MKFIEFIDTIKAVFRPHGVGTDDRACKLQGKTEEAASRADSEKQEPVNENLEFDEDNIYDCCLQLGLYDFTTQKGVVGFYLDPGNRWLKLAEEIFSAEPELDSLYRKRMEEMRNSETGSRLADRLAKLKQDKEVEAYGEQLTLPFIDAAVLNAISEEDGQSKKQPANSGRDPFSFRLAFGILVVQSILGLSDRATCSLAAESPYIQKFLGYESFSSDHTVDASSLVHFRKRLDMSTMQEINRIVHERKAASEEYKAAAVAAAGDAAKARDTVEEQTIDNAAAIPAEADDGEMQTKAAISASSPKAPGKENSGTLILDATCGPVSIRYPQDFSLLNEARLDLEQIINRICSEYHLAKPRTYVRSIQKEAQSLSKSKKKTEEQIRHVIRIELNAIERNLGYIERFLSGSDGVLLKPQEIERIQVIRAVYAQQRYMYDLKLRRVSNRIVSISMPFIRPISRGKANRPTEFGPKYDIAVDEDGYSWITSFSFDNFSESTHLEEVVRSYRSTTGHYPERVLVDQIYRTKGNRKFCKEHGIRISGPALGRKPKDEELQKELIRIEKQDMTDRISVERRFSREKRCFGIAAIVEKTQETIGHAVGMAVFLDNVVPIGF